MGVLSKYFPRQEATPPTFQNRYQTFTEYAPSFSAWDGSLYDHPLTRAAIERFADACSKLKPEFVGSEGCRPNVRKLIETWPNELQTWPAFLARAATIYEMDTTLFIVPGLDRSLNTVAMFPLKPSYTDICEYEGEPWCVFHMMTGAELAIELKRCAVISKFQYLSEFFGSGNDVMKTTLSLMDAQRQAEELAVQDGAKIRFIGKVTGMTHDVDLKRKREQFYIDNLSAANYTGLLLYDDTIMDLKQIEAQSYLIDGPEMERVEKAVFRYFGTPDHIIQNSYDENQWGAWYEGKVEPFALKLSEAMSKANFTARERRNNYITFSSSRLQYASNVTKLKVIQGLGSMGHLEINEGREIFQLAPLPGGNVRSIRGEVYLVDEDNNIVTESGGHDTGSVSKTDDPFDDLDYDSVGGADE